MKELNYSRYYNYKRVYIFVVMFILGYVIFIKIVKKIIGYERSKYKCILKCIFCLIMSEIDKMV